MTGIALRRRGLSVIGATRTGLAGASALGLARATPPSRPDLGADTPVAVSDVRGRYIVRARRALLAGSRRPPPVVRGAVAGRYGPPGQHQPGSRGCPTRTARARAWPCGPQASQLRLQDRRAGQRHWWAPGTAGVQGYRRTTWLLLISVGSPCGRPHLLRSQSVIRCGTVKNREQAASAGYPAARAGPWVTVT